MGTVQLQKLERLCKRRLELVNRYDHAFSQLPQLRVQARPRPDASCWHLMIVRAEERDALYKALASAQIGSQVHYYPVHLQPYYRKNFGTGPGMCPAAEAYYTQALSLPLFPTMSDADQARVIKAVKLFYADRPTFVMAAGAVAGHGPDGHD
jgi:perosamine synthetase